MPQERRCRKLSGTFDGLRFVPHEGLAEHDISCACERPRVIPPERVPGLPPELRHLVGLNGG